MIAATAYDTDGEEVTGLIINGRVLTWHHGNPELHPIAAVLHESPATNALHDYRRLSGWLATRNPLAWPHIVDAHEHIGDHLVPVGPPPPSGPPKPTAPRPLAPVRAGWFVD